METLELVAIGRDHVVAAMEAMTLYLTVVTGYLIVAYSVGKDLSMFQMTIITSLFLAFSGFFTWGTHALFMMAHDVFEAGVPGYNGTTRLQGNLIAIAEIVGIFAALAFMHDSYRQSDADT